MNDNVKTIPKVAGAKKNDMALPIPTGGNIELSNALGKSDKEPLKRINFNLTEGEHAALKMACIREKTSISDVMSALVRGWMSEHAEK